MPSTSESVAISDGQLPVEVIRPAADRTVPAVVVAPPILGVHPDLLEQMNELAGVGANVLAMDPFWRSQPGAVPYANPEAAMARMRETNMEQCASDFITLTDWTRLQPNSNGKCIGIGICFGGPFCFVAAGQGKLDGVVTWHGSRLDGFLDAVKSTQCPLRLHFGDQDQVVPMTVVDKLRAALGAHPDTQIYVHPGAGHGFSHRSAPAHREDAERAGVQSAIELIRRYA